MPIKAAKDDQYKMDSAEEDKREGEEVEEPPSEATADLGDDDNDESKLLERTENQRQTGSFRRLSKRLSHQLARQRSSVVETLPETSAGWVALLSTICAAALGYEIRLQKSLTVPPIIFGQFNKLDGSQMESIYNKLTERYDSILSRVVQPSLFVGTRGAVSSAAAYLFGGPGSTEKHIRFREILTMSQDGAKIAVDWECLVLPHVDAKKEILGGPIDRPVVIVLHGINNDASFGYVQSLMRTFANRGWVAAGMNFRGCGGVEMATPRGYNAAYTGDLRNLVLQISSRMGEKIPIFLVGNSLGANIMTKYLGEEGYNGTLPMCVAGAVSLGNPLEIHSSNIPLPFSFLIAQGIKKVYFQNMKALVKMRDSAFRRAMLKGLLSNTVAGFDHAVAPQFIRNNPYYPYQVGIGYEDGEAYWKASGSYRFIGTVSIPFLNLTAGDDFLVSKPSRNKIGYCLVNPNVMVVETRCGGHLGWHESPVDSDGIFGETSSWADSAAADFFQAIIDTTEEREANDSTRTKTRYPSPETLLQIKRNDLRAAAHLQSRL